MSINKIHKNSPLILTYQFQKYPNLVIYEN